MITDSTRKRSAKFESHDSNIEAAELGWVGDPLSTEPLYLQPGQMRTSRGWAAPRKSSSFYFARTASDSLGGVSMCVERSGEYVLRSPGKFVVDMSLDERANVLGARSFFGYLGFDEEDSGLYTLNGRRRELIVKKWSTDGITEVERLELDSLQEEVDKLTDKYDSDLKQLNSRLDYVAKMFIKQMQDDDSGKNS